MINLEQTIFDIFLNAFDEDSQLRTKNKKVDNSFDIVIETQLQIWVNKHSKRFLKIFIQTRFDKNIDIKCIKNWNDLINRYNDFTTNYNVMKINCKIAKIKTTKFEIKKTKFAIKKTKFAIKKKYKTIIKQLRVDNIVFRKTFFVTTNKNKKKKTLNTQIHQNSNIISTSFFMKFEKF